MNFNVILEANCGRRLNGYYGLELEVTFKSTTNVNIDLGSKVVFYHRALRFSQSSLLILHRYCGSRGLRSGGMGLITGGRCGCVRNSTDVATNSSAT